MQTLQIKLVCFVALGFALLSASGCGALWTSSKSQARALPAAAPLPSDAEASEMSIRFLEHRVKGDPDDFIAYNKLVGYYLQRLRETGDLNYLNLASRGAHASLKAIPAEQNLGGLNLLGQVEYASHNFAATRDHALRLKELAPNQSYPYQLLGDALLELGDYDQAEAAYRQMERRGSGLTTETRLAHLARLRGKLDLAEQHATDALGFALQAVPQSRETVAWCRWQLGELAFARGDYETAERHYRDSLITFPNYFRALASLGRVRAARSDLAGAIERYESAVRIIPEPTFVAALGDLYQLAGRATDAAAQYALCEQIGRLSTLNGTLYNRQLALFYADHDLKPEEAYTQAAKEYEVRRDIYGADAVAWAALKSGRTAEAQAAIKEALRLGTQDALLFYHAGMIARVAGERATAHEYLKRALTLNPQFDPRQAPLAQRALAE